MTGIITRNKPLFSAKMISVNSSVFSNKKKLLNTQESLIAINQCNYNKIKNLLAI